MFETTDRSKQDETLDDSLLFTVSDIIILYYINISNK